MKWAGLILLIITIALALYLVWFVGGMPGRVAAERGHPKADAIFAEYFSGKFVVTLDKK